METPTSRRLSAAVLATSLPLAFLTGTPRTDAAEPAVCEWVFDGGGGEHDKTRAVAFDGSGNVFLASECVGDAVFGGLTRRSAGGMDMVVVKLDPPPPPE